LLTFLIIFVKVSPVLDPDPKPRVTYPDPAKSFGSLRIRIHNTVKNISLINVFFLFLILVNADVSDWSFLFVLDVSDWSPRHLFTYRINPHVVLPVETWWMASSHWCSSLFAGFWLVNLLLILFPMEKVVKITCVIFEEKHLLKFYPNVFIPSLQYLCMFVDTDENSRFLRLFPRY
jgi:hypothetical protein